MGVLDVVVREKRWFGGWQHPSCDMILAYYRSLGARRQSQCQQLQLSLLPTIDTKVLGVDEVHIVPSFEYASHSLIQ